MVVSSNFAIIRLNQDYILPEYLLWRLNTADIKKKLYESSSSNMLNAVRPTFFAELEILPLTLADQGKVAKLNLLAKQETQLLKKLADEKENNAVDIDYLISYFLTKRGTDILEAASPGGAGRNRTLGQDRFLKSKIVLPPIEEQQKITEILITQDKIIELKEKLIDEKQRQKKYLAQQLLTGKKRLPGFGGVWETIRLRQIVKRHAKRNTIGNTNVLTISAQYGLINQAEFFNKVIASDDKSKYSKEILDCVEGRKHRFSGMRTGPACG